MVSDEATFGTHAASIAATGRDLTGAKLPVFLLASDPLVVDGPRLLWYQPVLLYAIAATLKIMPLSEWAIRLPNALMALISIALVYVIGCRLFNRQRYALAAALMFAMMPAYVVLSRRAFDYVCPVPFALFWFWSVQRFRDSHQVRHMVGGGVALGVGLYSYIAAWAHMPFLLALTPLALAGTGHARRGTIAAAAGFVLMLGPLGYWLLVHPETLQALFRNQFAGGTTVAAAERVAALASFDLGARLSLYWSYFSPSFLFFSGGPHLAGVRGGVMPLAMAVFIPVGIYQFVRHGSPERRVLLAAMLFAPMPIVMTLPMTPAFTIGRAVLMLPFAALIAGAGVERLMNSARPVVRLAALALLLAIPFQFTGFIRDYFTDYQVRTARLWDPLNTSAVADFLFEQDRIAPIRAVYLPSNFSGAEWTWRYLTFKTGREDLWARTAEFDPSRSDARSVPMGAFVVLVDRDPATEKLRREGGFSVARAIPGLDGEPAALILRKQP